MAGDKVNGDDLWQDKDIRFDVDHRMLRLISGEVQIDRMDMVEDTKGNNGDREKEGILGVMRVTNLRVIWYASSMPRINLSIGYGNITGLQSKEVASKVRGSECEALYILARGLNNSTKFEFIFTAVTSGMHSKLFNTINSVHRAYETTKLYRELKMRGAILDDNDNLKLLPLEQLIEKVGSVWNLSTDQGTLGSFVITNCRVVWFASMNSLYNVSVPYLQLFSCRIRESKFGLALVLETTSQSGEYVLGFRIDPSDRLQQVCKTLQALHKNSSIKPIFGVTFLRDKPPSPRSAPVDTIDHLEEDVEVEQKQLRTDAFAVCISQLFVCLVLYSQSIFAFCINSFSIFSYIISITKHPSSRIPPIDPSLLADVACLKKITFYYEGLKCFEKAVTLSALKTVRSVYSAIIVDVSSRSVPHRLALCTCLALLHEFACGGRKAVVVLPKDEDWMMLASLYTDHLFELKEDGHLTNLVNHELLLSK
uniref:Bardet-Biedl syndrome 5 n=1 Tax=Heterorhabditis bacteriophora TaxID=37862 RepID=A0A1I7XAH9_HETBA